ncbi:MAG: TIGR03619 family F420-dependent LLM class oxidoreductase [Nitrososphaerales archaeon]
MEFGVLLPTEAGVTGGVHDMALISDMAQSAEEFGYHSLWVGDRPLLTQRLEPLTTLGFAAAKTKRVRLGTAVLVAPLRNPVQLAQAVASLDVLSGGRMILGLGAGAGKTIPEFVATQVPFHERGGIFNECIRIVKKLWSEDSVTFDGKYYTLKDVALKLKPRQHNGPPILVGGFNEQAFKRAATIADGWFPSEISFHQFEEGVKKTASYARESARDPSLVSYSFYITINLNENKNKAAQAACSLGTPAGRAGV